MATGGTQETHNTQVIPHCAAFKYCEGSDSGGHCEKKKKVV